MTLSGPGSGSRTVLLEGGSVLRPDGSIEAGDVVIRHGRISFDRTAAVDATIDCAGATILPGFIDSHVHVMTSSLDIVRRLDTPLSYLMYQAAHNLEATLRAGVTTVRDAAGADAGMKQALADGLIIGPRLLTAVAMISQTGGHGDRTTASGTWLPLIPEHAGFPRAIADGPDEVRRMVRLLVREGADVIKVATSGGVMSPRSDPRRGHFRPAELEVVVEEAAAAGIPTMAHAQSAEGIKNAVRAGFDSIDHGVYLDEEAIELMVEHGTFLVPTLVSGPGVLASRDTISPANVRKVEAGIEAHMTSISAAVAAGVRVAMGTDSGVTRHGDNLRELALMEQTGMTPPAVLLSATREAAELLGVDDQVGTVEEGKVADLVVRDRGCVRPGLASGANRHGVPGRPARRGDAVMTILERFGATRAINAAGFATRVGGALMHPDVMEAMAEAAASSVDMTGAAGGCKRGDRTNHGSRSRSRYVRRHGCAPACSRRMPGPARRRVDGQASPDPRPAQ